MVILSVHFIFLTAMFAAAMASSLNIAVDMYVIDICHVCEADTSAPSPMALVSVKGKGKFQLFHFLNQ